MLKFIVLINNFNNVKHQVPESLQDIKIKLNIKVGFMGLNYRGSGIVKNSAAKYIVMFFIYLNIPLNLNQNCVLTSDLMSYYKGNFQ